MLLSSVKITIIIHGYIFYSVNSVLINNYFQFDSIRKCCVQKITVKAKIQNKNIHCSKHARPIIRIVFNVKQIFALKNTIILTAHTDGGGGGGVVLSRKNSCDLNPNMIPYFL